MSDLKIVKVHFCHNSHTQSLFHNLNLLKIQDICKLEIAKSLHHSPKQSKKYRN